ncbi:MAG: glycosyltransferase [Actinomycetota bacterium]|nr:glycosyltransferase [Actinomycetota bacterium]
MTAIRQAGASYSDLCGVRDWAATLAGYLPAEAAIDRCLWWEREDAGRLSFGTLAGLWRWHRELASLEEGSAVVWHYTVFTYGVRGIPVFAPMAAWWMRRSQATVVVLLHEFAHPRRGRGWRGYLFAATSRLVLAPVLWASNGVIVTSDVRARWLGTRRWLPRRPTVAITVSSTLPDIPDPPPARDRLEPTVGVFVSGSSPAHASVVTDAIELLRRDGLQVRLVLFGGATEQARSGAQWRCAAATSHCEDAVDFTGRISESELVATIRSLDVIVAPSVEGATSTKTTIASALANGAAVVALSGPETWQAFVDEGALVVVNPLVRPLADALRPFLVSEAARRTQGERGAEFYRRRMSGEKTASRILAFANCLTQGTVIPPSGPSDLADPTGST